MWSSEIDPFCIALTAQLFPDVEQLGDIKKLDAEKVTREDNQGKHRHENS